MPFRLLQPQSAVNSIRITTACHSRSLLVVCWGGRSSSSAANSFMNSWAYASNIGVVHAPWMLQSIVARQPCRFSMTIHHLPSTELPYVHASDAVDCSLIPVGSLVQCKYIKRLKGGVSLQRYWWRHLALSTYTHSWGYLFPRYKPPGPPISGPPIWCV